MYFFLICEFYVAQSFTEIIEYLFSIPNVTSFLSERLQQDPIEKYFGRQQQRGRVNENPTVAQYLKNEQVLRVISSIDLDVTFGGSSKIYRGFSV